MHFLMREDLINHIIKKKKIEILGSLIFGLPNFRKMHFLNFWPLGLHKTVKKNVFLKKKIMYCIQESKMLNNWTTKLFFEKFEFSLEIPDLATQIKKMLNFLRRSSGWFSKGTYRRTILNKKTSTIMHCTGSPWCLLDYI